MNYLLRRIKLLEKSKKIKALIILSIIILLLRILLGVIYINNIQKKKIYQLNNRTSYEVALNPNIYFGNNKLKANNFYIANSIKSININFDYYLKNQTKENINYSYNITATLKSYADNGTKLIWTKDFNLKNINNINEKEINIKENYILDYQNYVNYVKSFQKYYNIKTETYLYVKLNIKINDNPYVLLTIPISENIIEITMKEDNAFLENKPQNIDLTKIIVFIISVIVIILLVNKFLFNKDNNEDILKEYQDIIITIQNTPNINNNIIYLNNLKDLVTIAVNNNINVFNYNNNYYTIIDNTYILKRTI